MKKKITIITISLIILLILGISFSSISNAAIEIKPETSYHTTTATIAYQYCYDMRSSTSTLGNNTLDPHLSLNADWGAMAYLGASAYGSVRSVVGKTVTGIGSYSYDSTTNNITGVMIHKNETNFSYPISQFMSAYIAGGDAAVSGGNDINSNLTKYKNTKYVEIVPSTSAADTKGMALGETSSWYGASVSATTKYAIFRRTNTFSVNGTSRNDTGSYRPVIWN